CLCDVAGDPSIRPNQLFAISLPYPLIDGDRAASVLGVVEERLLTPVGLRTLDPGDPNFVPRYAGNMAKRDAAYHQGTVWPWLIGPYVTALMRVRGDAAAAKRALAGIERTLDDGCIGSIAEVYDATEPHTPGGCVAPAWSVAEVIRAAVEDVK